MFYTLTNTACGLELGVVINYLPTAMAMNTSMSSTITTTPFLFFVAFVETTAAGTRERSGFVVFVAVASVVAVNATPGLDVVAATGAALSLVLALSEEDVLLITAAIGVAVVGLVVMAVAAVVVGTVVSSVVWQLPSPG